MVGNSGAQAMNLATLAGARRLILVGFDMQRGPVNQRGEQMIHWHGDHPKPINNTPSFAHFVRGMGRMAADLHAAHIEVINTCARSALPYFPKRTLEQALE